MLVTAADTCQKSFYGKGTRQFSFRLMAYNEMTQASVDLGLVWPYSLSPGIIRHLDLILPKKDLMAGRPKAIG